MKEKVGAVLVIGGGIAGIQASLDLANSGFKVYLVDESPTIGGTMAQLDKTFPTNDCAMCNLAPKLVDAGRHPSIKLFTYSEVKAVSGSAGNFRVKVLRKPRFVDEEKCTGCGECAKACPVTMPSEFDTGLGTRKAIYRPFPQAIPNVFTIDKKGIPPCRAACPAGVNVQGYVALITQGKFKEALELIRRYIPFPAICGRVCFHPCEDECERGKVDEPLAINALKRFVAAYELKERKEPPAPIPKTRKEKIAVIGSGPAGLTAAYELVRKGYPVTVFESLPEPGGMLRVGIPEYRLPKSVLSDEIEYIKNLGVEIRTNTAIGKDLTIDGLLQKGYDGIFVAVGAQKSRKLGIEGEDLKGVMHALALLKEVNLGKKVELGDRIAVIGGGNVAIDVARTALRLGAKEVSVLYRRSRPEMPANPEETEEAEREGVKIRFLLTPRKILGVNGKVTATECVRMKLGEPDETGRRRPIPIEGSEHIVELDTVILAIGESPDVSFLPKEIQVTRRNTIVADPLTLETGLPSVFAGGDAVSGPATVIEAIAAGKRAAVSIDRYLRGEDLRAEREEEIRIVKEVSKEGIEKKTRQAMPLLPLDQRVGNKEVALGFTEEMAVEEAGRCLFCAGCSECLECEKVCELEGGIVHQQKEELIELKVGAIIVATGFEIFDARKKSEYGYGRYPNVITSLGLERLLNASGPTAGHVMRPSDGRIPKEVAFVQCVGSRDYRVGNPYCSGVCCMYAVKNAMLLKEHVPDIDVTVFYIDIRAYGKEFEEFYQRAREEFDIHFIRGSPSEVIEDPETKGLIIRAEDMDLGGMIEEEVDLVVLSVGMEPPKRAEEIAKILSIKLNKYNFCATGTFSPLETSRPGIYVCGAFSSPKDVPESVAQASGAAAKAASIIAPERWKLTVVKEYPPEKDVSGEEPRIGVFVCHCGINIGGVVNVPEVVEYAKTLPNVAYAEHNLYSCSQDTQERMKEKIKEHNLNRIIVASCTPRTHESLFRETIREAGLNFYLFEMANIRDQCSWVHLHEPKEATEKAKDLVRMAVAKARLLKPLPKPRVNVVPVGLVIGGGLSGMTAALELAKQGFGVHLVEKEKGLGGNLRHLYYLLGSEDPQEWLKSTVKEVTENEKIHVHLNTEVAEIKGYIGNFKTTLRCNGEKREIDHGIVIVATGAVEYEPIEYLYGVDERVLTQRELEERLAKGRFKAKTVVMIQCVGSRNKEHPNCSRICCSQAVKNALKIKELSPGTDVYVLYKDVRTYGFKEDYYREAISKGVLFLRYDDENKPQVAKENGALRVLLREPLLKTRILIEPDLLILSAATIPNPDNKRLAEMLKVPLTKEGFFSEAHVKLRPVDFATDGIFLCGLAHSPRFTDESISQACAVAARAATILSKKMLEVEGIIASVDEDLCVGCCLCEEVCPYGAVKVENRKSSVIEALCKGCGLCASLCPEQAISMGHFTKKQVLAQIATAFQR